jgi:hypothetical protein
MLFLAEEFHDIAPPVDYSLVPAWLVFLLTFSALVLVGLAIWAARKYLRRSTPVRSARERALDVLRQLESTIETTTPYQFSIRVSDVLRQFVVEEFNVPMTRQTSVEFLSSISSAPNFKENDRALLADFLTRCDLIKFARYEATTTDSQLLLDEARRFVKGEILLAA